MKLFWFTIILSFLDLNPDHTMQNQSYTFLALGDSYTIGEAVEENERWPVQLANRLKENGIAIESTEIVAKTGWTTDELQKGIEEAKISNEYSIVSLLIGVNNQYRGYEISQYEKEFGELLDQAIGFAGGESSNVFVVSIPDYGVTPFSKEKGLDSEKIARELDLYNEMAERITKSKNANFTSITEGSKKAREDLKLVATDGLHPSGKMYTQWVDKLFPSIYNNLFSR